MQLVTKRFDDNSGRHAKQNCQVLRVECEHASMICYTTSRIASQLSVNTLPWLATERRALPASWVWTRFHDLLHNVTHCQPVECEHASMTCYTTSRTASQFSVNTLPWLATQRHALPASWVWIRFHDLLHNVTHCQPVEREHASMTCYTTSRIARQLSVNTLPWFATQRHALPASWPPI